jgi:hypothetical protein
LTLNKAIKLPVWGSILICANASSNSTWTQARSLDKLAYDNGWDRSFAERVLAEYRRYVYLAATAEHVVVPSDQVDAAWHQHLIDTEQYWGSFCETVLFRPLHHHPNKDGAEGRLGHRHLYQRSLEAYAQTFGCEPPQDIWPPAADRFGPRSTYRRVGLAHSWIVPKQRVLRIIVATAVALGVAALAVPFANGATTFVDYLLYWNDLPFVAMLALLTIVAIVASIGLTARLLGPPAGPLGESADDGLDSYDAAALAADCQRAVNAAVAALI